MGSVAQNKTVVQTAKNHQEHEQEQNKYITTLIFTAGNNILQCLG